MSKTLLSMKKKNSEAFVAPKSCQDAIPIKRIYDDGIFQVGRELFSKTFKFTDINYAVADYDDKQNMLQEYADFLSTLDAGVPAKITINNRRINRLDIERTLLLPDKDDGLDDYRHEYNRMLLDKATGANAMVQDKYFTLFVFKKTVEEARAYFNRAGAEITARLKKLGSICTEMDTTERLRLFHDFYRVGEESNFDFDIKTNRRRGHSFKDYIAPDSFEFEGDHFKIGDRYGRVLFLREYGTYIKDTILADLTALNRNIMLSVDIIPVPIDESVKEAESRLLGVETNITNWRDLCYRDARSYCRYQEAA